MGNRYPILNDAELRRQLTRVALTVLDSVVIAEEIVQEAYIRLLESDDCVIDNPASWLIKVTRNLAIDQARRRLREREILTLFRGMDRFDQHHELHAAECGLAEMVSCLLHVSDSRVTAIVLLHIVFGMSYNEIAAICGRSPAACRQTGRRAIRKCFSILDANEPYDENANTGVYVHAILEASIDPLIDSLSTTLPVNMQCNAAHHVNRFRVNLASKTGRTRQVLVLTATGVQWALVLDGIVLCLLGSSVDASFATVNS